MLANLPSSGSWLARQLIIAHRGVVNECRHDRGSLFHVVTLNAVEHILIRMVCARVVFNFVLDELEAR